LRNCITKTENIYQFDVAIVKAKEYVGTIANWEFLFYYKLSLFLNGKYDDIRSVYSSSEDIRLLSGDDKTYYANQKAISSIALLAEKKDL